MKEKSLSKKTIKIGTIVMMLAFGLIAFICLNVAAQKLNGSYDKADIVISIKAIPKNTQITTGNVNDYFRIEYGVNVDMVTEDSVKSMDDLVGLYANENIHAMETIVRSSFTSDEDKKSEYNSPVEISFGVDTCAYAVSGTLRKGDYITIYTADENMADVQAVLKNVYISDAFNSAGEKVEPGDTVSVATMFNVYLEKDAEKKFYENIEGKKVIAIKNLYQDN